jgi:endogenous inhibitor of DNA gyrase (YacG/DUF329 family)
MAGELLDGTALNERTAAMGICPYCDKPVTELNTSAILATNLYGGTIAAFTYSCPTCGKILGCQIDPIALNKTHKEIAEWLSEEEDA